MDNTKEVPVSVHYGKDGEVDGILVKTIDESFIVALHDAEGGKKITWNEAMEKHKDEMPTKKQALIICAYLEEINSLLVMFGGDELDGWYWTESEYYASSAWFFSGTSGCFDTDGKYYSNTVRPVLASA